MYRKNIHMVMQFSHNLFHFTPLLIWILKVLILCGSWVIHTHFNSSPVHLVTSTNKQVVLTPITSHDFSHANEHSELQ